MKSLFRKLALIMTAVLCASCIFAGLAMAEEAESDGEEMLNSLFGDSEGEESDTSLEDLFSSLLGESGEDAAESSGESSEDAAQSSGDSSGESSGESMGQTMSLFAQMLGMEELADFDWEGFYADLYERIDNGEQVTLEEAFPEEYWMIYEAMMNSSDEEEEDDGMTVTMEAVGNELISNYVFDEQVSEEDCQTVVDSVTESFESEDSMLSLKEAMEGMSEGFKIDINEIKMTLRFTNADETVIYEKTYTYKDLEDVGGDSVTEE